MDRCKNCGYQVDGKYCSNCSQKASTHRLTVKHILHEGFHAVTHTDTGILYLIKELTYRPGFVAREYLEGKRKKYYNPFTFLMILIAIQALVAKQTNIYGAFNSKMKEFVMSISKDSSTMKDAEAKMEMSEKQLHQTLENTKLVNLVALPFVGIIYLAFFQEIQIQLC
jgi:hypothetical protein